MSRCRDPRPLFRRIIATWGQPRVARVPCAGRPLSFLLAAAIACFVAACATPPSRPRAESLATRCVTLFERVDAAVAGEGVGDAMATRIPGFPYLRVDRLLASFRDEVRAPPSRRFWISQLAALDAQGRAAEVANLPERALAALTDAPGGDQADGGAPEKGLPQLSARAPRSLPAVLDQCRDLLVEADLAEADRAPRLDTLRAAATVPDDYSLLRRVVGLYPLTRIPFAAGVRAFEREVESVFALPLEMLPRRGRLQRFAPAPAPLPERPLVAAMLRDASANPLRAPYPDAPTLHRLAEAYAPIFEIDVAGNDDRPGHPRWPASGPAIIDITEPAVFFRAARTRVADRVLLQLVYTAWFPARPPEGRFDLLGGHLDALVWRVTLAPDGEPLLFDSIHGCGCYHFFFPTPLAQPRPAPRTFHEWRFVPQEIPRQTPGERVVLRVAAGTHYLQRIRYEKASTAEVETLRYGRVPPTVGETIRYTLVPDDSLRSLPRPDGGRRSLYDPDGFVAGSERAERFVFWPMGIVNPGAMRQWGRHATAFVGRRHFDDPRLVDDRFAIFE